MPDTLRPVAQGQLGVLNTTNFPEGPYTIRLMVRDLDKGYIVATVTFNVKKASVANVPTPGGNP